MTEPVETELVARLREFVVSDELGNSDFSVCDEAADEIERLRAELARVRKLGEAMAEELNRAREGWENVVELDLLPPQHRGTARDLCFDARTALAAWNEGAWRNAARTGGASPGLFPNPTPLRGRSA